jgi:hypothetical protein
MTIKEAKLSKKEKDANIIESILSEYSDDVENNIKDPKRETVWIPGFMFIYSDEHWVYDIDYSLVESKFNRMISLRILQDVLEAGIKKVIVGAGSQSVWSKDHVYKGSFEWGEGFNMISENPELTEKDVEKILTKKAIEEYKIDMKERETKNK